jgi:nucleoside-diphosphate-sugar epimerase
MAGHDNSSFKIVFMSSDSVYGYIPKEKLPATEDGPMNPANTYGASKAAAEMVIQAYNAQWGLPVMVLRGTTMFGEGSRLAQMIPIFIRQATRNEPITVEGDGSQTRDVNYVKNTANAILNALESPLKHGTWNIGSGKETSVRELAELIVKLAGSKSEITNKPWRPGERGLRLFLSIEKAEKELSYFPTYSQEEGLVRTIDWIKRLG